METRTELKSLYKEIGKTRQHIQSSTEKYIAELDGRRGIFLSDHSIRRYLERVKGFEVNDDLSDKEFFSQLRVPPEVIRDEMLTLEEDRQILRGQRAIFHRAKYSYVIKELTIITVLINLN